MCLFSVMTFIMISCIIDAYIVEFIFKTTFNDLMSVKSIYKKKSYKIIIIHLTNNLNTPLTCLLSR